MLTWFKHPAKSIQSKVWPMNGEHYWSLSETNTVSGFVKHAGRWSLACALSLVVAAAQAGPREQAKRIHDRIAGVPPSDTVLDAMELQILNNPGAPGRLLAAETAMANPAFYSVTLKNVASPWTNIDQDIFVPLNDYSATYVGLVRDGASEDFRQILSADLIYVGSGANGEPGYSNSNNAHYEALEQGNVDLGNSANLVRASQSAVTGLVGSATAGVMTTRAAAKAFFIDGTNRAMFRFTLMNHMCYDLEQVRDTTRAPDRIRQDVTRSPGGDSRLFLNNCVGCHSGMDPLAQAFAYYQYDYSGDPETGSLVYTDGSVQPKYLINSTNFPYGFVTPDDRWDNYWREGLNKLLLGWDTNNIGLPGFGNGAKSMGEELANSEAFARCHVQHAFTAMCHREPVDSADIDEIQRIVGVLKSSNYNMRQVYAEAASYCAGP